MIGISAVIAAVTGRSLTTTVTDPHAPAQLAMLQADLNAAGVELRRVLDELAHERVAHLKTKVELTLARAALKERAQQPEPAYHPLSGVKPGQADEALVRQAAQDRANAVAMAAENAELRDELAGVRARRAAVA